MQEFFWGGTSVNCLIVFPHELLSETRAIVRAERAAALIASHELRPGLSVTAGVLGGRLGKALVNSASAEELVLDLSLEREPPPRSATDVIVAVPRPQTIKKVLQLVSVSGIRRLHFVRTANVVKSYMQSKALLEDNVRTELLKGLEQACDTVLPVVLAHASLTACFESLESESAFGDSLKLLADTRSAPSLAETSIERGSAEKPVIMAIGPESGWSDSERERFLRRGFRPVSLGRRMLRVDTAMCFLVAQIGLLREQSSC